MNTILSWKLYLTIGAVILVGGSVVLVGYVISNPEESADSPLSTRSVTLARISELARESAPVSVVGTVRSVSEANLRAQVSGLVTRVSTSLGASVRAGTLLAEIENSSERAALLQAEGSLEAAEASLAQARAGIRSEDRSILEERVRDATAALAASRDAAKGAIRNAFEESDEAIHADIDSLFNNPSSESPTLKATMPIPQVPQDLEWRRVVVEEMLTTWSSHLSDLATATDLDPFLADAEERVAYFRDFVNLAAQGVNSLVVSDTQSQSVIDAYQTNVNAARSALNTIASSITTQKTTLSNKRATLEVAQQELVQGQAGQRDEEIDALAAQVKQAQGAYQQALAALEKTRIRAPITGTVNVLSIQPGDFVSTQDPVVTVANNGALEIETFITADDRAFITPGAAVVVGGRYGATVTSIGGGLDSSTKKVKVMIGLENPNAPLVHGDTVSISIERNLPGDLSVGYEEVSIPVTALKAEANRFLVFSVADDGRLVPHEVQLGALLGDRIIIEGGVTGDMQIVIDARGLSAGQQVMVAE